MRALMIVESMFGNTKQVADQIADALRSRMDVEVYDVAAAPRTIPADVTLLVIGGPTHAFGMSRQSTRADAAKKGASGAPATGLRDWLDAQPTFVGSPWVATFDTRIDKPLVPGSAARSAIRRLRRLGGRVLVGPQSFFVVDVEGPLREGEISRAHQWAWEILSSLGRRGLVGKAG